MELQPQVVCLSVQQWHCQEGNLEQERELEMLQEDISDLFWLIRKNITPKPQEKERAVCWCCQATWTMHCDKSFLSLCSLIPPPTCCLPPLPTVPSCSLPPLPTVPSLHHLLPNPLSSTPSRLAFIVHLPYIRHCSKKSTCTRLILTTTLGNGFHYPPFKVVSSKRSDLYLLDTKWCLDAAFWIHRGVLWP